MVLLLAISLSIDGLGIGLSYGVRNISIPLFTKFILFLETMFFMMIFLLIGNHIKLFFTPQIANHIGIFLLIIMGVFLLYQSFQTQLLNPSHCDKDHSSHIDAKEGLSLGVMLSIDSMGAGIGAGAVDISMLLPFFTAVLQILFLSVGIYCGKNLKQYCNIKESLWTAFSGCILIMIAVIRFL